MIKFKTAEEMVTWMKSAESKQGGSQKRNPNMFYCGGQKIKKSQTWKDMVGWDYIIEDVDVDSHVVNLKRVRDSATFFEKARDLVGACSLSVDIKNGKKIPV